ncbi:MAG: deoxyribose-phosphate aldolase [Lentimicrobium sp.]|nr:deoxyribose-phosphate aldolase [Lentimicrobium sp.]
MRRNQNLTPEQIGKNIAEIVNKPSKLFKNDAEIFRFALGILDLTTLEGTDTHARIETLCQKASGYAEKGLPNVAAVCVYPVFARQVKGLLLGTGIQTACVAGAFPSGQSPLHVKIAEVKYAVNEGADEIDMVISRGKFLENEYVEVFEEINAIKDACGHAHLKVILETGELVEPKKIYDASILAMKAGGDFIKTSTGKINPAATPEAAWVMLTAIHDFYTSTGKLTGFKPAGGIATPDQAVVYIKLVEHILGPEWMNNKLFRIGASRLADNLASAILKS